MGRLRVGVIGCGLIAQVMHLPHLREMHDRFELAALCDLSPGTLAAIGDQYHVSRRHTRWQDLVAEDLDVVMIFTSGSHAAPAIAAARAGRHVLIEKPMCYTLWEADEMIAAAAKHMDDGAAYAKAITVSYEEAFKRELEHFHTCILERRQPLTSGAEGRQDLAMLLAIARAAETGRPQMVPPVSR